MSLSAAGTSPPSSGWSSLHLPGIKGYSLPEIQGRMIAYETFIVTLEALIKATPDLLLMSYCVRFGGVAPKYKPVSAEAMDGLTPAEVVDFRKGDIKALRKHIERLEEGKSVIAGRINQSLDLSLKELLLRQPKYETALIDGNPLVMLEELHQLYTGAKLVQDDSEKGAQQIRLLGACAQSLNETIPAYGRRFEKASKQAKEQNILGAGYTDGIAVHLFVGGLHQETYGKYIEQAQNAKAIVGYDVGNFFKDVQSCIQCILRMEAPMMPIVAPTRKADVILGVTDQENEKKKKKNPYSPYRCGLCRNLDYPPGTEPSVRHFASRCPHLAITKEEKDAAYKKYQKSVAQKAEAPKQKVETVLVAAGNSAAASQQISTPSSADMKVMVQQAVTNWLSSETGDTFCAAVFSSPPSSSSNEDDLPRTCVLDSAATSCGKAEPEKGETARVLRNGRSVDGIGGSIKVTHKVQSSVGGLDSMLINTPKTIGEIVSLSTATKIYHGCMDFESGSYMFLTPMMNSGVTTKKCGYLFMEYQRLYHLAGHFVVTGMGDDAAVEWSDKNEGLLQRIPGADITLKRVESDIKEHWERAIVVHAADNLPSQELMLPAAVRQNPLPAGAIRAITVQSDTDEALMKLSKEQQMRVQLAEVTRKSMMCTPEGLKEMIAGGAIERLPFGIEDVVKAKEIFGPDILRAASGLKAKPSHVNRDDQGKVNHGRVFERFKGGKDEEDVLYVDCMDITGKNVLAAVLGKCKALRFLVMQDMTAATALRLLMTIVKFFVAKGRIIERVESDKGTNLVASAVTSALAILGIDHAAVATNKHVGQIEAIVSPCRTNVTTTLRNFESRWLTPPPALFLNTTLMHYANVKAYRTHADDDDVSTGQRLFGVSLDYKYVQYNIGDACLVKVPASTITKREPKADVCIYAGIKITPSQTCMVFNIATQEMDEVALGDLYQVKITDQMRLAVKGIYEYEKTKGISLDLGANALTKLIRPHDEAMLPDHPQISPVGRDQPADSGGERGGDAPNQQLASSGGERGGGEYEQKSSKEEIVLSPASAEGESSFANWAPGFSQNLETILTALAPVKKFILLLAARKRVVKQCKEMVLAMSLRKGMIAFPELWKPSAIAELENVFTKALVPVDYEKHISKNLDCVIPGHMLQDEKKDASNQITGVKSRLVASGNLQKREDYTDTSAPTISYQALTIRESVACYRNEHRVISDIGGAFLHGKHPVYEKPTFLRLCKLVTQLAIEKWPELARFVYKGSLYCRADYEIYGTLIAARVWAATLMQALKDRGYAPNKWESCLWSRKVNSVGITVAVFVDDQRWYCVSIELIRDDIRYLNALFGKQKAMKVNEERVASYLGLLWDTSVPGQTFITSPRHMQEILNMTPIEDTRATPGTEATMDIDETSEPLPEDQRVLYSKIAGKALFMGTRFRGDVLTVATHLTRRSTKANVDDWGKLIHLLQYFNGTKDYGLLLKPGKSLRLYHYADSALGNDDYHSTSGISSYCGDSGLRTHNGGGPVFCGTRRQKYRSTNSAHAELGCLSDFLPYMIWSRNFLIECGVPEASEPALIWEDNEACIQLATRGRAAAGQMSRHLALRMFVVKEYLDEGELRIAHIPTEEQRGDLLTKSVTGKQFHGLVFTIVSPPPGVPKE